MLRKLFIIILFLTIVRAADAQTTLKLFLNCKEECYEDFLKQELVSFNFVRDRLLSDVEILIIEQQSGNNGKYFTLEFIGRDSNLVNKHRTLSFSTHAADSHGMIRSALLRQIKLGLFKLLIDSPWEQYFEVETPFIEKDSNTIRIFDRWNYWVINPGIDGYVEGESNYTYRELKAFLNVRRITRKNKFVLSTEYKNFYRRYKLDSTLALGVNYLAIKPLYVFSLTRHWSVGALGNYTLDQFRNIEAGVKVAPVIEYNIFPIEVNAKKQLRIAYQAGGQYYKYFHPTVYNHISELRPYQTLSIITEIVQSWGSISSSLYGSTFLDNFSQNRLTLDVLLSFRLFKGCAFNIEGKASIINDQISLIKEPLDDTVYLLSGQQLPTTFNYWTAFGFSYTFGSIHNSIVNPRLGQVE